MWTARATIEQAMHLNQPGGVGSLWTVRKLSPPSDTVQTAHKPSTRAGIILRTTPA
jgi:hypothetical protein